MTQPELLLGPYRLVRLHRSTYLRIYDIRSASTANVLASLSRTYAPDLGISERWDIGCRGTNCTTTRTYPTREEALRWLGRHRLTKHPYEMRLEAA